MDTAEQSWAAEVEAAAARERGEVVPPAAGDAKPEHPVRLSVQNLDLFYGDYADSLRDWKKMGVLAVEMEAAALYMNAARCGKKALAIATVSDLPLTGEGTTAEERQTTFTQMMEIALEL